MTIESSLTFLSAIFIFAITPGPGVFAILARALTAGTAACFFLALGMVISDMIYLVLACYGLVVLAEYWSEAFMVVRIVGAIYLIYIGVRMWQRAHQGLTKQIVLKEKAGVSFLQGFIISASNPKVILFYIAFLPTFMDLSVLSHVDIALVGLLALIGLMAGLMLIAAGASSARCYVNSTRGQKLLNRTAGSVMIGAGGFLASSG